MVRGMGDRGAVSTFAFGGGLGADRMGPHSDARLGQAGSDASNRTGNVLWHRRTGNRLTP